jgi:hypothetical protein
VPTHAAGGERKEIPEDAGARDVDCNRRTSTVLTEEVNEDVERREIRDATRAAASSIDGKVDVVEEVEEVGEELLLRGDANEKHLSKKKKVAKGKQPVVEKRKHSVVDNDEVRGGRQERARQRLIEHLRRELQATKEGWIDHGGRNGRRAIASRVGSSSREQGGDHNWRRQSPSPQKALDQRDLLGAEWVNVRDVPPIEINRLGEPTGAFWDHMQPFVFERGTKVFPWEVD